MIDNFSLKPMILVIPVLLALVLIELAFAYLKGRKVYNFQDSITSINIGLLANGKDRGALLLDFSESPENRVLFTEVTGLS